LFTVPVYEVISLHSIAKRDADGAHKVRLKAFGEHHDLQLEPSDRLFTGDKLRAWTAHHNATTDTVHYTELPNDVSPHRYLKKYIIISINFLIFYCFADIIIYWCVEYLLVIFSCSRHLQWVDYEIGTLYK